MAIQEDPTKAVDAEAVGQVLGPEVDKLVAEAASRGARRGRGALRG
jgi:hypothetical protein